MSKLIVKIENNRFYLQSGNSWTPLSERFKNLADVKKAFNCDDIGLITSAGLSYQTIDVLGYDQLHLTLKDESGVESKIYFPEATEKQICDYLMDQGKSKGFNQVFVKFHKPVKDPAIEPKPED